MSDLGVDGRKEIKALCNNVVHSIANYAVILPYKSLEGSSNTLNAFATYSFPDWVNKYQEKLDELYLNCHQRAVGGNSIFPSMYCDVALLLKGLDLKRYRCGFLREGLSRIALKGLSCKKQLLFMSHTDPASWPHTERLSCPSWLWF